MKKFRTIIVAGLIAAVGILTSCEGFNAGSDLFEELTNAVEYANASYADITLNALNSYTESITPATGNYNNKYKAGDSMDLNFVPTSSYQFISWSASPAEAVEFEDAKSGKTKLTIKDVSQPITVEPVVAARPTVTFLPKDAVAVEKNTSIVITFSQAMNITEDDLKTIQILLGKQDALESYAAPVLDETKTVITFDANQENLLSFTGDSADVTVIIPQSFHYLSGEEKITLESEIKYTFTVNQDTLTKLSLSVVNSDANTGVTNVSGELSLNMEQQLELSFNALQEYYFKNWAVYDSEGNALAAETYSQFFEIADITADATTITAKKIGTGYVIKPVCIKRPQVVASTPVYDTVGANRASNVKFIFDQDMSESSIYWTEAELKLIKTELEQSGAGTVTYADFKADGKKDAAGNQYYYAYTVTSGTVTNRYLKNIEIKKRESSESLLNGNFYGCPYFETSSILVIPTDKSNTAEPLPGRIDIEVVLKKAFVNISGIELAKMYSACYRTDSRYDVTPPKVGDSLLYLGWGKQCYSGNTWSFGKNNPIDMGSVDSENDTTGISNIETAISTDIQNRKTGILQASSVQVLAETYGVKDTKTISIKENFTVTDETGISDIAITLTPVKNLVYPNQSEEIFTVYKQCDGEKKIIINPSQVETYWEFDLSSIETEGLYKLTLSVTDVLGNETKIPFSIVYKYDITNGIYLNDALITKEYDAYIILDNIFTSNYSVTKDNDVYGKYHITGNIGKYYSFYTYDDVSGYSQTKLKRLATVCTEKSIDTNGETISVSKTNYDQGLPYLIIQDCFGNFKIEALPL